MGPEPLELRMVSVALRLAAEDGSREQGLPPQSDEAARIEIARMN